MALASLPSLSFHGAAQMSNINRRDWVHCSLINTFAALLWQRAASGQQQTSLPALSTGSFTAISFSADGNRLLTATYEKAAHLWDIETGNQIRAYMGHTEAVYTAAFSADERRIVTGSGRETDMASVSRDSSVRIWDTETGMELNRLMGHHEIVYSATFSSDGRHILSSARDSTARVWDLESNRELHQISGVGFMQPAAFSPNNLQILTIERTTAPFRARLWAVSSGLEVARLEGHEGRIETAQFSSDGSAIVTASRDSTARIWDPQTGRELQKFAGHDGPVLSAAFNADGKSILTGSADGKARLWNVADGNEIRRFGHRGEVIQAMLKEGSRRLLTNWKWHGTQSTFVSLWDSDSGKQIKQWQLPNIYGRDIAIFTPDGMRFLITLTKTTLFNALSGDKVREFD